MVSVRLLKPQSGLHWGPGGHTVLFAHLPSAWLFYRPWLSPLSAISALWAMLWIIIRAKVSHLYPPWMSGQIANSAVLWTYRSEQFLFHSMGSRRLVEKPLEILPDAAKTDPWQWLQLAWGYHHVAPFLPALWVRHLGPFTALQLSNENFNWKILSLWYRLFL